MENRIEKRIELKAPVSRVWRALTDYREFGEWFRVKLDGPFVTGEISRGYITWPGYEHLLMEVAVQKLEPEHYFSYLASLCDRSQGGLLERDTHPCRIQAGEDGHRHSAHHHGVRL